MGIETKFKKLHYAVLLSPRAVPEMRALQAQTAEAPGAAPGAEELVVGGATTLGRLEDFCVDFAREVNHISAGHVSVARGGERVRTAATAHGLFLSPFVSEFLVRHRRVCSCGALPAPSAASPPREWPMT